MIQWYPGHMAKTKKNIEADLALVDMIIEVVDARIPNSSRNPDLMPYTKKKAHLLLLNKSDLADEKLTRIWLNYYRTMCYIPAAVNASRKQGMREMMSAIQEAAKPIQERLKAKGRLQRAVRAMVIGIPNCGKSTVINSLAPRSAAKTGNKPGVTRGSQWVKTNAGIELLDTPGMLWPKFADETTAFNLAVCGSISDSVFPVYSVACQLAETLARLVPDQLAARYKLERLPESGGELLLEIAGKRGLLGPGGKPRDEDAAMLLIQEFRSGKICRITMELPPRCSK